MVEQQVLTVLKDLGIPRRVFSDDPEDVLRKKGFTYADRGNCRATFIGSRWVIKSSEIGDTEDELYSVSLLPKVIRPRIWAINDQWLLMPKYRFPKTERGVQRLFDEALALQDELNWWSWDSENEGNWARRSTGSLVLIDGWGSDRHERVVNGEDY